ncbi:MAG: methylmalonyl-CoA/ethylmalonyl-CoA epimerase [Solirubrobacteraceae bacterium]|nr:methylmalonyl-CoA/ethylmalonyl-CoA epimerase [Solirubrobacteraceae bacterium]
MRFDHVGVLVDDLEAAKAFARDVLGLGDPAREFEAPEQGLAGAFFALGDGELELFTLAEGRAPDGPATIDHVAVRVDDLDAERPRLEAQGVRFTGPALPEHVESPVELRGTRHLWTDPATSGGYRLQLIEKPA